MPTEENRPDAHPAYSDASPSSPSADAIAMPAAPPGEGNEAAHHQESILAATMDTEQDTKQNTEGEDGSGTSPAPPADGALAGHLTPNQNHTPEKNPENDPGTPEPTANGPDAIPPPVPPLPTPDDLPPRYREAKEAAQAASTAPSPKSSQTKAARPRRIPPAALTDPGPAARLFRALSYAGLPVLLALMALMTLQELFTVRTLWFSDEVRHADVYMRLLDGNWLALSLNGVPYPDKPPLYFWLLELLDRLPGVDQPMLFFLGAALSAVLFTGTTWLLARATGHDRRVAFAAGLMTIGCLFVAGVAHYPRMDLLFAVVITLSMICLYRGWIKSSAPLWLTLGFVLAGVATLIKGPLGLAFPILGSILFLFWRGTPGRLNGRDGLAGFALMLIMLLAWIGALYFDGQADYLKNIFGPQIAGRMVNAWHHAAPWWYYLAALPLVWLPWTFLILFVNWWQAARSLPGAWKKRREDGGRGWLWLSLIGGVALLSAVSGKIAIYLLPLMPCMAVLSARALLNLSPRRSRWFYLCLGLFFALLGVAFILAQYSPFLLPLLPENLTAGLPPVVRAYLDSISGLGLMGLALMALAVVLLFFTRRSLPEGGLLLTTLGIMLLMQPYALVVAPSLDTMLSPRAQAEAMADYARQGFQPAAYRVYPGIYAYYFNNALSRADLAEDRGTDGLTPGTESADAPAMRPALTVPDIDAMDGLLALLAEHPRVVVAMREKDWNRWADKPNDMHVVQQQWIVDQPYVLVVRDGQIETDKAIETDRPVTDAPDTPDIPGTNGEAAFSDVSTLPGEADPTGTSGLSSPAPGATLDAAPGIPPDVVPSPPSPTESDAQPQAATQPPLPDVPATPEAAPGATATDSSTDTAAASAADGTAEL